MEFLLIVAPLRGAVGLDLPGLPLALAGAAGAAGLLVLAARETARGLFRFSGRPVLRLIDGGKTEPHPGVASPCGPV